MKLLNTYHDQNKKEKHKKPPLKAVFFFMIQSVNSLYMQYTPTMA